MQKISLKQAGELITLARKAIESPMVFGKKFNEIPSKKEFLEKRGIFVTLKTFPKNELRGCIGYPYPTMPLWNAVIKAAESAAFEDNRFEAVTFEELEKTAIEISVLTIPIEIDCSKGELPAKIEIGKDGLIIQSQYGSGLLLPQVAIEEKWNSKTFLEHLCHKAGLPPEFWKQKEAKIFKFQAQIFKETKPSGKIEEEK